MYRLSAGGARVAALSTVARARANEAEAGAGDTTAVALDTAPSVEPSM